MLQRIGLTAKLVFSTLLIIVLLGGLIGYQSKVLSNVRAGYEHLLDQDVVTEVNAHEVTIAMLTARRAEKDFLLRKDEEYLKKFDAAAESLRSSITLLKQIGEAARSAETVQAADAIASAAQAYTSAFKDLAAGWRERGLTHESGLQASFRAAAKDIEDGVNKLGSEASDSKDVLISLLQLRRHEKDYLLRGTPEYITKVAGEAMHLIKLIDSSGLAHSDAQDLKAKVETYRQNFEKLVETDKRIAVQTDKMRDQAHKIEPLVEQAEEASTKKLDRGKETLREYVAATLRLLAFVCIGVLALSLVLTVLLSRSISKPLRRLLRGLRSLSTQELEDTSIQLSNCIDGIMRVSSQTERSSAAVAQGACEQASSLEEVSASLTEITSVGRKNVESISEVAHLTDQVKETTQESSNAIVDMLSVMEGIKTASDKAAEIVKTINEIAFQTNLLALNAAVEAARAGDAGRGFAVVAEEVRSLAQRSAAASQSTTAMIDESQKKSESGVEAALRVKSSLQRIAEGVDAVVGLAQSVDRGSREQSSGMDQIHSAVEGMNHATQANAAAAEEMRAQATELENMAHALNALSRGAVNISQTVDSTDHDDALSLVRATEHQAQIH